MSLGCEGIRSNSSSRQKVGIGSFIEDHETRVDRIDCFRAATRRPCWHDRRGNRLLRRPSRRARVESSRAARLPLMPVPIIAIRIKSTSCGETALPWLEYAGGSRLEVPDQPTPRHDDQQVIGNVDFPPKKSLSCRIGKMMMVVVPALTKRDHCQPQVIAAIVVCFVSLRCQIYGPAS